MVESNEQVIISKTYRANYYEFGKAGNRFKLYFEDADDLKNQIDNLIKLGLFPHYIYSLSSSL